MTSGIGGNPPGSVGCPDGHDVPTGARFCPACGVPVPFRLLCPVGHASKEGQAYCAQCGLPLSDVDALERSVTKLEQVVSTLQTTTPPSPLELAQEAGYVLGSAGVRDVGVMRSWSDQQASTSSLRLAGDLVAKVKKETGYTLSVDQAVEALRTAIDAVRANPATVGTGGWSPAGSPGVDGLTRPAGQVALNEASSGLPWLPRPQPINVARQKDLKSRNRRVIWTTLIVEYTILAIPACAISAHLQPGAGGMGLLIAAVVAFPLWLLSLLIFDIVTAARGTNRNYTQTDIPDVPRRPDLTMDISTYPDIRRDTSKVVRYTNVIGHPAFRVSDYPMTALLDEDWIAKYRYRTDADIPQCVHDMCGEVAHNWSVAHPDAPASAKRPAWFENMDEQAECLLGDLQTCEAIATGNGGKPGISDEEHFRRNLRWPDEWYQRKGLPIPPPGPDPDWKMSDPAGQIARVALGVGVLYYGAWKPISKGLKNP